ncbi:MAG: DNA polymerase II large subunit [Natronomonas sp.]
MRDDDEAYFERLEDGLDEAMELAREARQRGGDPTEDVEIPIAKDMADRVENILGIDGVAERVREMEEDPDLSREEAALELAEDFAEGRVGDYDSRAGKVEGAVRTAVALLTEGVVAAPIEGIDRVEILDNDDGTEFINVYYAGPIRSAGGTAQALSVLVADYTRTLIGIEEFKPRDEEVERYAEELALYDNETGLQYSPKDAETKFIARNMPIMLDGEATGDEEVSGFRDLERVDTNNARGGMCLVLGEGIAQKAPKIQRYTSQLEEVDWPWLQDLIDGSYKTDKEEGGDAEAGDDDTAEEVAEETEDAEPDEDAESEGHDGPPRPEPSKKFLRDLIAGRPVFGHPSEEGGFRLRYGRSRNHGFATAGVHPATMHLVDDFLATGTQIKTERPGKAAGVIPVDSIEGPTVKLANGDVRRIDDPAEALEIRNGVEAILDLGEYLVNYGEFVENNHPLSPASYTPEWWKHDLAAAGADVQALEDSPRVDLEHPETERVLEWVDEYDAPLHPEHTYLWHDLDLERFEALASAASDGHWAEADGMAIDADDTDDVSHSTERTLVLPRSEPVQEALEVLIVEHTQGEETLTVPDAVPLVRSLGLTDDLERTWEPEALSAAARNYDDGENAVKAVNEVAPFEIQERAPTRIGCRMGRPEKSEKRDLSPAVHTLFPIGEAGGSQRDIAAAGKHAETMQDTPGMVEVQVGRRNCPDCGTETHRARCPDCNAVTEPHYVCYDCDIDVEPDEAGRAICPRCEREADAVQTKTIDVNDEYRTALSNVKERENAFDVLKGVKGLTSEHKVPEPIEKGVLRAKNGVSSFKDGTVRYDMTDLPVTSVRASELDVTVGQLQALGYEEDIHGQPLTHEDQLVELRVQDVVLSDGAAEHMIRTADFVDDLLEQYYGLDRFYELEDRDDLVGELVFGMAPHTSAAVVGRVIGFTSAAVGYAHPYFHAAKRRNCDGDEDCVMLLMDGLLNFSKSFLPNQRGGRMDAPLVMSSRIDPAEIDDEAHNMDITSSYPRAFYEATREMADPGEVEDLVQIGEDTLGTDDQYRGFEHTHDTTDIALGPDLSAYKTLGDMMEKMNAQLELSRKLRSVDETDVAERVIEYHFLPDIIGNLRAFSRQETRCLDCGEKFRRMPLTGDCRECGGRVNLTVHQGSVNKYIDTAIQVAEEYGCREYTKQRLQILDRSLESIFEDDTNKQSGIADFM